LAAEVPVFESPIPLPEAFSAEDGEHVHRVIPRDAPAIPFHFGKAEWQRKGLGRWCSECASDPAARSTLDGM